MATARTYAHRSLKGFEHPLGFVAGSVARTGGELFHPRKPAV